MDLHFCMSQPTQSLLLFYSRIETERVTAITFALENGGRTAHISQAQSPNQSLIPIRRMLFPKWN